MNIYDYGETLNRRIITPTWQATKDVVWKFPRVTKALTWVGESFERNWLR